MTKPSTRLLLILGALNTVSPFSVDLYLPAFPQIAEALHTTTPKVAFSLSSYFIGMALGQLFYGPFLDRFGRKRPLYFGLSVYLLATAACIFSPTINSLIIARFFQALGGCAAQVGAIAMVRDFYPEEDRSRVFSRLMLILSVSPLFAPTVGSFLAVYFNWQILFVFLFVIVLIFLLIAFFFLPEGHVPDPTISLRPAAVLKESYLIFRTPNFFAFAVSGAFSFSGLFVYVAGASSLFMESFKISPRVFGAIFALLSVGLVGGGQVNIWLMRFSNPRRIFQIALATQLVTGTLFFVGSLLHVHGLIAHVVLLFLYISCVGLTYPNAATLALAPFAKNTGSAAALLGFLQMAVGSLASSLFGLFNLGPSLAITSIFLATSLVGCVVLKLALPYTSDLEIDPEGPVVPMH